VPGSGHYWAIDIRNGEGNKRDRKRKDPGSRGSSSRPRSDEEDDFSEDVDEERSNAVARRRLGEQGGVYCAFVWGNEFQLMLHQATSIPIQFENYSGNPCMFPSASTQTESVSF
jgi:hypothetical protein